MFNPAEIFGYMFAVGFDIMSTTLDASTKVILAQLGSSKDSTVDGDRAEMWQHAGFASRPAKATAGVASCQGLAIRHTNRDMIFATRDTRGTKIYGNLLDGETCVYAPGAQCRMFFKADGSVTIYTAQGNVDGGASCVLQLNPDGSFNVSTPLGAIALSTAGLQLMFGTSSGIQIDANGVTLIGKSLSLNGGAVLLGSKAVAGAGVAVGPSGGSGAAAACSATVFCSP